MLLVWIGELEVNVRNPHWGVILRWVILIPSDIRITHPPHLLVHCNPSITLHLLTFQFISIREHPKGAIIGTCDIWDTDYNTDNWEPEFMTIFVTWQLIVTLDSIRKFLQCFFCSCSGFFDTSLQNIEIIQWFQSTSTTQMSLGWNFPESFRAGGPMEKDVTFQLGHLAASLHKQIFWGSQHGLCLWLLPRFRDTYEQVASLEQSEMLSGFTFLIPLGISPTPTSLG